MSSSDRAWPRMKPRTGARRARLARPALLLAMALALPACTVAPLYGTSKVDALSTGAAGADLAAVRGRISVSTANDRTAQIFRNALLTRLNGGATPTAPLYEIRFTAYGSESVVSIQQNSGIPAASLYRFNASYQVVRLSDGVVIGNGNRFATAPFDRSKQLYASSRALIDARERAGSEAAERVELAVAAVIAKDLRQAPPAAGL